MAEKHCSLRLKKLQLSSSTISVLCLTHAMVMSHKICQFIIYFYFYLFIILYMFYINFYFTKCHTHYFIINIPFILIIILR